MIIAENGAVLYDPGSGETRALAAATTRGARRGTLPSWSRATRRWHLDCGDTRTARKERLEIIKELGLELQVIFNKGAVMILPAGGKQGQWSAGSLGNLWLVACKCHRRRRCGERSCLPRAVRTPRGSCECPASPQGKGSLGDKTQRRCRSHGAHRSSPSR